MKNYDAEKSLISWLKLYNAKDKDIAEILIKLGSYEKKIEAINILAMKFNGTNEFNNIIEMLDLNK